METQKVVFIALGSLLVGIGIGYTIAKLRCPCKAMESTTVPSSG